MKKWIVSLVAVLSFIVPMTFTVAYAQAEGGAADQGKAATAEKKPAEKKPVKKHVVAKHVKKHAKKHVKKHVKKGKAAGAKEKKAPAAGTEPGTK